MIVRAVQVERLLVKLRYLCLEGGVIDPLLERVVQNLDNLRLHAPGPGDAVRRVYDHVDAGETGRH